VDGPAGYDEAMSRSGITLGAIAGRLLAQEMIDGTADPRAAPAARALRDRRVGLAPGLD
jgi:glycine/D-amino acid oxidase-like deaminating enzyme